MQWEFAAWGLFGGVAVEGLDLYKVLRCYGRWPWKVGPRRNRPGLSEYCAATIFHLLIGAGLALAAAESHQVGSPMSALTVGIAAPIIVERLLATVQLVDSGDGTTSTGTGTPQGASTDLTLTLDGVSVSRNPDR